MQGLRISEEQIDKTQVRVKDNKYLHVHPYDPEVLEKVRQDMFKAIENLFEMHWTKTDINYQPTSGAFPRHVDFLATTFKRAIDNDPEIANTMYDPMTKNPVGWRLKRVLVAMDNWYPGQLFGFEEHTWSNWRAGQTIAFNWSHCRHFTANSGYNARPLLKITGLVRDDHWLSKKQFRSFNI
jgi:hypothetical protein